MKRSSVNCFCVSFFTILLLAFALGAYSSGTEPKKRVVFPNDLIRVSCWKSPALQDKSIHSKCTWKILNGEQNPEELTTECTKTNNDKTNEPNQTRELETDVFEGYIEIPERATGIFCMDNFENGTHNLEQLEVQDVRVASPLSSYSESIPKIILQRFSDDFGIRFHAHDVTNKEVKINGHEVDSLKLICIHSIPVQWENITESRQKINEELRNRNKKWLLPKSQKLETSWNKYFRFIQSKEESYQNTDSRRYLFREDSYTTILDIQNITSMTSRTYECRQKSNDTDTSDVSSSVSLTVENPRSIGPDEIELIEQILGILNSMAHDGKGHGKEPWAALGSVTSVVLIVFLYYIKAKRDQRQNQSPPKTEETEMSARLQPSPSSSDQQPSV